MKNTKIEMTFAKNLTFLVEDSKLSQSTLAKKLGINKSTFHNYLYGIVPQGLNNAVKIAHYFNIDLEDLLIGDIQTKSKESSSEKINSSPLEQRFEITLKVIDHS